MSKPKRISVAEYLTQQINICGKSQKEIADEVGYEKPNVITMFKQGKTKLPINKVGAFAKALGIDPLHLLRIAMSEYTRETWDVIEELIGKSLVTQDELAVLEIIRTIGEGQPIAPRTAIEVEELKELATKWRKRVEMEAQAAAERVARDKGRPGGIKNNV